MSVVTISTAGAGATPPHSPRSYEPQDLLNSETAEAAARYLSENQIDSPPLTAAIDQAVQQENRHALLMIWRFALMGRDRLAASWSQRNWFIEAYAQALIEAAANPNDTPFKKLVGLELCEQALLNHSETFDQHTLYILIEKGIIRSSLFLNLEKMLHFQPMLEVILAQKVLEQQRNSNIIRMCKKAGVNSLTVAATVEQALDLQDSLLISRLIIQQLLNTEQLLEETEKREWLLPELSKLFEQMCPPVDSDSQHILDTLIIVGVDVKQKHIDAIAQAGNYPLLEKIQGREMDITSSIFRLIETKDADVLRKLLEPKVNASTLNPNLIDGEGNTLLKRAVIQDSSALVELLLEFGANPLLTDGVSLEIFEIAKIKSYATRRVLYHPPGVVHSMPCRNATEVDEEKALRNYFKKSFTEGVFQSYAALFMSTNEVTMAILRPESFAAGRSDCWQNALHNNPTNSIHCWTPRKGFLISPKLVACETTMFTLGFAIIQANLETPPDQIMKVNGRSYGCLPLKSTYQSGEDEYGFKYKFGNLASHGHGKNPNAALAEMEIHQQGLNLDNWVTLPDLREIQAQMTFFATALDKQLESSLAHKNTLDSFVADVNQFYSRAKAIIDKRHTALPDDAIRLEENEKIRAAYEALRERVAKIQKAIFTTVTLQEWQKVIGRQFQILHDLQQKLETIPVIDTETFKSQYEHFTNHLEGIKKVIVNRTVTAAEVAHFKVYESALLIENIFRPSTDEIPKLISAMYQLIGKTLEMIPLQINRRIGEHSLNLEFRESVVAQLLSEANYLLTDEPNSLDINHIQQLASYLATLKDTHEMLILQPPVVMHDDPEGEGNDLVLERTVMTFLRSYQQAREILDEFWRKSCCLDRELDSISIGVEQLSNRLLLMDREISIDKGDYLLYPTMDSEDPRHLLNESLFILQTAFFSLQNQSPAQFQSFFAPERTKSMRELIFRRLKRAGYGGTSVAVSRPLFILSQTLKALKTIKKDVVEAYETSPKNSPFHTLFSLLKNYDIPSKSEVEVMMTAVFTELSDQQQAPNFSTEIRELINTVQKTAVEISKLGADGLDQQEGGQALSNLKSSLKAVITLMKEAHVGESEQKITYADLQEIFRSGENLDPSRQKDIMSSVKALEESELRSLMTNLSGQLNKLSSWETLKGVEIRTTQKEINRALHSIRAQLNSAPSPLDNETLETYRTQCSEVVHSLLSGLEDDLVQQLGFHSLEEKLVDPNLPLPNFVMKIRSFVKGLDRHIHGKSGKNYLIFCEPFLKQLTQITEPILKYILIVNLEKLEAELIPSQEILRTLHLPRLMEKLEKLNLGIRGQTYYTDRNKNVTSYLWAGAKFNDCPYHSAGKVHIPLVNDPQWSYAVGRTQLSRPPKDEESILHLTQIQEGGIGRRRRKGDPSQPLPRSFYTAT